MLDNDKVETARVRVACVVEMEVPLRQGDRTEIATIVDDAKDMAKAKLEAVESVRVTGANVTGLGMGMHQ